MNAMPFSLVKAQVTSDFIGSMPLFTRYDLKLRRCKNDMCTCACTQENYKMGLFKEGAVFLFSFFFLFPSLFLYFSHIEKKKKRVEHIFTSQLHDSIIRNTLLFKSQIQTQLIDFFFLHLILNPQSPT